jgi:hypothetical protein
VQVFDRRLPSLRRVTCRAEEGAGDKDSLGLESGVCLQQVAKALREQQRRGENDHAERHLCDKQGMPECKFLVAGG